MLTYSTQNVSKAQAEIDRLEAEANAINENGSAAPAKKSVETNGSASAGASDEKNTDADVADTAAEVADELEKTKLDEETTA